MTQKGYKFLDLTTKNLFVSRYTIFHENIFPFYGSKDTNEALFPSNISSSDHDEFLHIEISQTQEEDWLYDTPSINDHTTGSDSGS